MKLFCALLFFFPVIQANAAEIRIGIIGLDGSHCIQFAKLLQGQPNQEHVDGARIIAAYKGGSPDIESSAQRVDGFTKEITANYGVVLCDTIEEVVAQVDAVMILSIDGRTHLAQAKRVFPFHKPIFIDKPVAASVGDAIKLFSLAKESNVPCFTASSMRFGPDMDEVKTAAIGRQQGAFAYGSARTEPHHPDLFWYGIHPVEMLYAAMGPGCQTVVRTHTVDADLVTGVWSDGRTGTVRGGRNGTSQSGLTVFGTKGVAVKAAGHSYAPLLREIVGFFKTGISPVPAEEAIEVLAFMEAADESKRRGGQPVAIEEIMKIAAAR